MNSRIARGLKVLPLALIAGATLLSGAASAQYYDMHCTGVGYGTDVSINYGGNTNWDVFAGQIDYQLTPTTPNSPTSSISTYCVDLTHEVSIGDTYLVEGENASTGLNNGGEIAYLDQNYANTITNGAQAAGLQVAIWKLLSDPTGTSLTQGNLVLNTTGSIATDAESYLQDAVGHSGSAVWADASLNGTVTNHEQSQIFPPGIVTVATTATPEPGITALLCAVPTAGLVFLRRRRRTRK